MDKECCPFIRIFFAYLVCCKSFFFLSNLFLLDMFRVQDSNKVKSFSPTTNDFCSFTQILRIYKDMSYHIVSFRKREGSIITRYQPRITSSSSPSLFTTFPSSPRCLLTSSPTSSSCCSSSLPMTFSNCDQSVSTDANSLPT